MGARRPGLRRYDQASTYQKVNSYILSGYRCSFSVAEAIRSVFYWTNETLNIWTHFLCFLLFLFLLATNFYRTVPGTEEPIFDNALEYFLTFILALSYTFTMGTSVTYHTFSCVSERVHIECFRYDVAGILVCFTASIFTGTYYSLWRHPGWCVLYVILTVFNSFCLIYSLLCDKNLSDPVGEKKRQWLVALFLASGIIPIGHAYYLEGGLSNQLIQWILYLSMIQYLIELVSFSIYFTRIPERFFPGLVDYVGHSHQWWHLGTFLGCVWWHEAVIKLAIVRKTLD